MLQEENSSHLSTNIIQENCTEKPQNRIFLFNGPPESGKDELAKHLARKFKGEHLMFKKHLYLIASRTSGVPYDTLVELATNRSTKEQPHLYFVVNGQYVSPRQYLIHISENLVKPTMGADFFGKQLAKEIMELGLAGREGPYFVSDSGFVEEAVALKCLKTEVTIVRIHRPDYTFKGDSRGYLTQEQFANHYPYPLPYFKFKDIHNKWDLKHFLNAGEALLGYGPFSTLL